MSGSRVAHGAVMSGAAQTSTGLTPRSAATLSYLAWWLTGLLFWVLEREDRFVRFHAAQALIAFGSIALLIAAFGAFAVAALSFFPSAAVWFLAAAGAAWIGGMVLWLVAMWKAAGGDVFRIPLAAGWADRLNREW